jgi:hypothetical protein
MFVALVTTTVNEINVVEHLGVDTAERLGDDIEDYWVAYVVLVPALLGTFLGFILLGVALILSRVAHIAAGILIIVGIVGVVLSDGSQVGAIIANALLLAGWGLVGLKLLGMKDEQWDGRAPLDGDAGPEQPLAAGPPPPAAPPPNV